MPGPLRTCFGGDLFKLAADARELILRRHPFGDGVGEEHELREVKVVLARGPPAVKAAAHCVGHGRHGHQAEHGYTY
jgi:hypothetical protein